MKTLISAEHDNQALKVATLNAGAAAQAMGGDIDVLVVGSGCQSVADQRSVIFFEKLGTIYDKTQRIRKLAAMLSDDLNLNKEKIQIAASISKSDLCSD